MAEETIRLGVIGCGGFGLFALQHFEQVPGVQLAGMAGTHREAAQAAAKLFGIPDIQEVNALVHRSGQLLRALLADQVAWIRDHAHPRRITQENGRASLALAIEATRMANAPAANP